MSLGIWSVVEIPLGNEELMDSPRDNQYYLRLEIKRRLRFFSKKEHKEVSQWLLEWGVSWRSHLKIKN
jgi:hypothetical protein